MTGFVCIALKMIFKQAAIQRQCLKKVGTRHLLWRITDYLELSYLRTLGQPVLLAVVILDQGVKPTRPTQ